MANTGKKVVSLRDFLTCLVEVSNEGGTISAVAKRLEITPAAVSSRIKSLREKGVTLPEFASSRGGNLVEDAKNILESLGVEQSQVDDDEIDEDDEDEDEDEDQDEDQE
jgi:Mn-dependent DtxR family transcriptional regulator